MAMRRVVRLGATHMRALGAVGGVVACVGAGVAVAASPKPSGAPLTPPVDPSASLNRATPTPSPTATPCAVSASGARLDPALASALQQIAAAKTRADRQAVLSTLTADQRQQLMALMRARAQAVNANGGRANTAPMPPSGNACTQAPLIKPQVIAAAPSAPPVTNSYVS